MFQTTNQLFWDKAWKTSNWCRISQPSMVFVRCEIDGNVMENASERMIKMSGDTERKVDGNSNFQDGL